MPRKVRSGKLNYALKAFKQSLNSEQLEADKLIKNNPITVLLGKAGTGKTLLACYSALEAFAQKEIDHIYITRPQVVTKEEDLGFMPGDLAAKMDPWVAPIWGNFETILGHETYEELKADCPVKIVPFAYLRGRTLLNAHILVDEAQNVTTAQMEKILGRLGKNSKMVFSGDSRQCDLKPHSSGLPFLTWLGEAKLQGINSIEFTVNHRHPILDQVLTYYEVYNGKIPA